MLRIESNLIYINKDMNTTQWRTNVRFPGNHLRPGSHAGLPLNFWKRGYSLCPLAQYSSFTEAITPSVCMIYIPVVNCTDLVKASKRKSTKTKFEWNHCLISHYYWQLRDFKKKLVDGSFVGKTHVHCRNEPSLIT